MVKLRGALRRGGDLRKIITKEKQAFREFQASVSKHQEQKRLKKLGKLKRERETLIARLKRDQAKFRLQDEISRHKKTVKKLKSERFKRSLAGKLLKKTRKHIKVEVGIGNSTRKKARRVT